MKDVECINCKQKVRRLATRCPYCQSDMPLPSAAPDWYIPPPVRVVASTPLEETALPQALPIQSFSDPSLSKAARPFTLIAVTMAAAFLVCLGIKGLRSLNDVVKLWDEEAKAADLKEAERHEVHLQTMSKDREEINKLNEELRELQKRQWQREDERQAKRFNSNSYSGLIGQTEQDIEEQLKVPGRVFAQSASLKTMVYSDPFGSTISVTYTFREGYLRPAKNWYATAFAQRVIH
jgi:hypothetical protein